MNQGKRPRSESAEEPVEVSAAIQDCVGEKNYRHWFLNRCRCAIVDDKLVVFVANPFIANWMMKRFRTQLNAAAAQVLGPSAAFRIDVDFNLKNEESEASAPVAAPGPATVTASDAVPGPAVRTAEVQAVSQKIVRPARTQKSPAQKNRSADSAISELQPLAVKNSGRRRFRSFASFVAGPCNELALLASRQVSEAPGERFNPLYIHGGTGLGKTHLLEAIYSEVRRTRPELNVMYISSEAFTNYFTQALESRTVPSFRQRFRNVDVLLVDNIEFLDNKKATQEEFLHTIVQVTEHGGQLVVSGDRHPRLLTRHREELTTRFTSGLVCRVEAPAEQTRRSLVQSLALPMRSDFTQEALNYVARKCQKNVREIQGALNCLHGHASLTGTRITVTRAREILGDMERECRRLVRISDVEKVICEAFGISVRDLRSKSRRRAVACPRSLAMYMARKLTRLAYREIGQYFGGRDHSTVVAAEKRVSKWMEADQLIQLPNSCRGRTVSEVVAELEERLLALAC
jgi:chromosomal replication initiator protein